MVAWEVLESQSSYLDGKEGDLFSMILRVRYRNKVNVRIPNLCDFVVFIPFCQVLEGTNAIRDALTSKADPVYGLTTMHASLRLFYSDAPPTPEDEEIKAATYAFGLMALGKFILRLPAEIAEEEIPRLKGTLITVRPFIYIFLLRCRFFFFSRPGIKRQIIFDCPRICCGIHHRSTARFTR